MNNKTKNIGISILFIVLGAVLYHQSLGIKTLMSNDVGSAFFPKFVAISTMLIALVKLGLTIIDKNVETRKKSNADMAGGWMTIVLLGLYVVTFSRLGFIVSTAIYLFLQILVLKPKEKKNYHMMGAIAVVMPVVIYTLFVHIINMPLPRGIFGF
ncbi:tripartite tricarboxylate transporter TctB family protein [Anoxynatronum buryatiense]|uniref:Tripartite tricarboxylate transporter TctB family protein n=1 Tax=Anoxynatronum buryatiense TaxID=489973 RepID=A0AA45WXY0_9CLOT|nr:tripartite tricarboxylate transporter TctB family protein [Anoxynatronum buryatiense]SMP66174.1 Tripartite tricarboxylate transporter TctB family protein [Anoxynatronum buryatiense]